MEVQFKRYVRIICDLEVGDVVQTVNWGYKLDKKDWIITDIKYMLGRCESSFMIKIDGYEHYIDSNWVQKVPVAKITRAYCGYCDGCGWYEGGKTLQTTCEYCKGTGFEPIINR
jgi:hypothetical protein